MTLKDCKEGMSVKVEHIEDFALKERLMTMGIIPGAMVTVLRSAPLGDPIAVGVRSYNLAMRRDDAEKIEVTQVG
ncbi:MAG: ferrous iron transport protein A [Anaerovibrio sp.]|uniref:FeoA family protein n=1 Tax=Anaerovibrio sp. TaxID=1872532 RepID=UPI0025F7B170|nr:FeoA family protein [Anaerovibrio sp.]MCR5175772.1 ferrous iron transport protein A [Anaerovibrio sp.]